MRINSELARGRRVTAPHRPQRKDVENLNGARWHKNEGEEMFKVSRMIELTARLMDGEDTLGNFMASATNCSARVLACCSHCDRFGTIVRVVTEDAEKTADALAAQGIACRRNSVVVIHTQSSFAAAAQVETSLALANIPVLYSYSSWDEENHWRVVFKTADDARAVRRLQAQASQSTTCMPNILGDTAKESRPFGLVPREALS
jgi:hypothetical protein